MRKLKRIFVGLIAVVACTAAGFAQQQQPAQAPKPAQKNPYMGSPFTWNIDEILDDYISRIGSYYNLSQAQEEATRKLMTQRVKRFLGEYERDIRAMYAEMLEYQFSRQVPPTEIAREWAKRGQPLVAAIKAEIMDGTMTWRNILNDDQKVKHDKDLDALEREFKFYEERFDRWSRGDVRDTDFGPGRLSNSPARIRKAEDAWEAYVRTFKANYNLNPAQRETADSILRELREEAAKYREAKRDEFAELESSFAAVTRSEPAKSREEIEKRSAEIRKLNEKQKQIEHPISVDMFKRLKERLESIPTADQRKTHDEHLARLEQRVQTLRRAAQTRPASSRPSVADSQPAQATAQ